MEVARRIRRDAELVAGDPEAAALLESLGEHLFDPALDTHFLTKVCGASRKVRDRLAAKIGPLKAYITELRMAEAERLVRGGDEPVAEIGRRVGYPVPRSFRRAFRRAHGVTPSAMREEARQRDSPPDPAADDRPESLEDDGRPAPRTLAARLRRRATLGLLGPRRAADLRRRLRRRHPGLDEAESPRRDRTAEKRNPVLLTPTGDHLERLVAEVVFDRVLRLPDADLRHALLEGVHLGNPVAYRQLHRAATGLLPVHAERAATVAELGVRLIEVHRDLLGEEHRDWRALAWAFLGRVRTLAGDYGRAEQALGFAWEEVRDGAALAPWAEIEVRRVESLLRLRQRRCDEAERALDRAVALVRAPGGPPSERLSVIFERVELASALGDGDTGLALSPELEELVEECASPRPSTRLWRGLVFYHRALAHAAAGDDGRAEACLLRVGEEIAAGEDVLAAEIHRSPAGRPPSGHAPAGPSAFRRERDEFALLTALALHESARIAYRGGLLADCDELLHLTLGAYRQLDALVFEAMAGAELAVVCALRRRDSPARELASAAADFFDGLPFHREARSAARRLRSLADGPAEASEEELRELLASLRRDLDLVCREVVAAQLVGRAPAGGAGA